MPSVSISKPDGGVTSLGVFVVSGDSKSANTTIHSGEIIMISGSMESQTIAPKKTGQVIEIIDSNTF